MSKRNVPGVRYNPRTGKWDYGFTAGRDETGKRKQVTKRGFDTQREAQRARTAATAEYHAGKRIDRSAMTVGEYLQQWVAGKVRLRATTRARYESIINHHLVPALGAVRLQELTKDQLTRWYRKLLHSGLAPKSIRHVHAVLRQALQDAMEDELVLRNVAALAAKQLPAVPTPKLHTWSPEQLRVFLASVANDRLFAAWRLVAATGMRRGEVVGLRWEDVDLATGTVTVADALVMVNYTVDTSTPKTKKGERRFRLDPATVAALKAWRKRQTEERLAVGGRYRDSGRVFTYPDGSQLHPQRFSDWYQQHSRAAGLPRIRLHDMRHSYATAALRANVQPKIVSERLGHSTVQFTMDTYMHVLPAMDQEAADTIAAVIDG
jgi:integrase